MIEVKNVHKRYGEQEVLDGVDFHIDRDTITTIMGRSGGGKSVLLKHMIGLESPDSGEILFDKRDICCMPKRELNELRKSLGILFQGGALFDSLTVGENVAFPIREHTKKSEEEIRETVDARLRLVSMDQHSDKYPSQISGGMAKRAALARALALDPDLVFFDEPTSGLDPLTRASIYDLIIETHCERAVTYVLVSHDIHGAFQISHKVMMLWNGKIRLEGTPDEVKQTGDPVIRQFINGSEQGPMYME